MKQCVCEPVTITGIYHLVGGRAMVCVCVREPRTACVSQSVDSLHHPGCARTKNQLLIERDSLEGGLKLVGCALCPVYFLIYLLIL